MNRLGAIVRFLMIVTCLVPFTNVRQATGVLAPLLALALAAPDSEAPGEEDDERETDTKERLAAEAKHRPPARERTGTLPSARDAHRPLPSRPLTTPPVAADPFRNGLGTPYRC